MSIAGSGLLSIEKLFLGNLNIFLNSQDQIKEQLCFLSLAISFPDTSLRSILMDDRLNESTINYSELSRDILVFSSDQSKSKPLSAISFISNLESFLLLKYPALLRLEVTFELSLTKSLPYCRNLKVVSKKFSEKHLVIEDLFFDCRIGLHLWECNRAQPILLSFLLHLPSCLSEVPIDYFYSILKNNLASNTCKTLEKFAASVCAYLIDVFGFEEVALKVAKPWGIKQADGSAFSYDIKNNAISKEILQASQIHDVQYQYYVSLGSNLDDRKAQIQGAVRQLENHPDIKLINTSFMYESDPMYLQDQPTFLNCCILIETSMDMMTLLGVTQQIEQNIVRSKTVLNGPRRIDIDLIYCKNFHICFSNDILQFPHPRVLERAFVLKPILDMDPMAKDPSTGLPLDYYLSNLTDQKLYQVIVLGDASVFTVQVSSPYIMGILNVTPDSFSDGGFYNSKSTAEDRVQRMLKDGAHLIDIGGQSTRPGATLLTPSEELERVKPILSHLKQKHPNALYSVDSFSSKVIQELLPFGIHLVNDISGGTLDPDMFAVMAHVQLPYVISHIKGTPATMNKLVDSYKNLEGLQFLLEVLAEVEEHVDKALSHGIYRWNIIVDPGIGFVKTAQQNISILKHLASFKPHALPYPVLLGVSRKKFLRNILAEKEKEKEILAKLDEKEVIIEDRLFASVAAAILPESAWMIRVHDVAPHVQASLIKKALSN